MATLPPITEIAGPARGVTTIVELPGTRFAAGCSGHRHGIGESAIRVWEARDCSAVATLRGHVTAVVALAVVDDRLLVSGGCDGEVRVWDVRSYAQVAMVKGGPVGLVGLAAVSGGMVVGSYRAGEVRMWEVARLEVLATLRRGEAAAVGRGTACSSVRLADGSLGVVTAIGGPLAWDVALVRDVVAIAVLPPVSQPECCCVTAYGTLAVGLVDGGVVVLNLAWGRRRAAVVARALA